MEILVCNVTLQPNMYILYIYIYIYIQTSKLQLELGPDFIFIIFLVQHESFPYAFIWYHHRCSFIIIVTHLEIS